MLIPLAMLERTLASRAVLASLMNIDIWATRHHTGTLTTEVSRLSTFKRAASFVSIRNVVSRPPVSATGREDTWRSVDFVVDHKGEV